MADELAKREKRKDYFQEYHALVMFLQICEGIQHLHQDSDRGGPYAHRDIKPHNILLREDFTPVIMDLGSVESARTKITTHSEAQYLQDLAAERCSMPYRPPELFQVNSKCDIDERTDVWVSDFLKLLTKRHKLKAILFRMCKLQMQLEKAKNIFEVRYLYLVFKCVNYTPNRNSKCRG